MSKSLAMLARVFVLKHPWQGLPKLADFEIVEEKLSDQLNDGGMTSLLIIRNFTKLKCLYGICLVVKQRFFSA